MAYSVKLDNFEGPLDLLLHLISKSRIKIEDISIEEITEQYLDYLEKMKKFDIEIASEFLVMAATLIYIKSRSLLPRLSEPVEDEELDPKQELILRLTEYKKYKVISEYLRKREEIYSAVYYKLPEEIVTEEDPEGLSIEGTSEQLLKALLKLLSKRQLVENKNEKTYGIKKDSISVNQRIRQLEFLFWEKEEWNFYDLFSDSYTKTDIIVTFLAILEMLKNNDLEAYQKNPFDDIILRRRDSSNG